MSRFFRQTGLRLRSLFGKAQLESDLDEEMQYHLERQIEEGIAQGLSPAEARFAALRTLGAITQNKELCRDMRQVNWIQDLVQDLHYGARTLRRNPAFSVVAVLALALGIGANAIMFSVAYGILLRPLPYADADRVAAVYMNHASRDFVYGTLCFRDFLTWKENNRSFDQLALFRTQFVDIGGAGNVTPEQVGGAAVTVNFFNVLGVAPITGRTFSAGEDQPGTASLAVIGESFWRSRFAGRADVLGQTLLVNGAPATIIGVMPNSFRLPRKETEVWTNLPLVPPTRYGPWFYRGLAKLKPGVTFDQARAEMEIVGQKMAQQNPYYKSVRLPVLTLRDAMLGTTLRPAILVLGGAVGLVLLIAVVNVANLLLARATARQREIALRLSLGAGSGRLIRQLLAESSLLSAVGGMAGLAFAAAGIQLLRFWNPGDLPLIDAVRLDWIAAAFVILVSMLTGILFGLAPALTLSRTSELNATIKDGAGRSGGGGHSSARARTRAILVISEIALSLILLVGAGLLLRSFVNLQQVNGGFTARPQQLLSILISPRSEKKYNEPTARMAFYDEVLRRTRQVPGVEVATLTDSLPPERQGDADSFLIEGQTLAPGEMNPVVSAINASPGYFQALQVPVIAGRDFTDYDRGGAPPVVIISEGFAKRFFPGQNPLGKRMKQGDPWMEIVGIVGNVKYLGLTVDTDPAYYMPFAQTGGQRMYLAVRTSGEDAAPLATELRRVIQAIDPGVTLSQFSTMEQALRSSISRPRFNTGLLTLFAGIALLLAAIGIYGLIAYSVAQRTHEIGVRMALGAAQFDVLWMVLRSGLTLAGIGVAIGLTGALLLTRLLRTMLFGIGATDALTFAGAAAGIMLVVLLATIVPALHATRISSVVALRYE